MSDRSSSRKIGTWANNFDLKAPPGITSTDAFALFGWEDTRLGDDTTQSQDVFATTVQFAPIEKERSVAAAVGLAAASGLVVGGLVLLLARVVLRRRPAGQPPGAPDRPDQPEPATTR